MSRLGTGPGGLAGTNAMRQGADGPLAAADATQGTPPAGTSEGIPPARGSEGIPPARGRVNLDWLKPRAGSAWQWVENIVITLAAIGLGFWTSPEDPFFIRSQFPWVWLGPVLLAQRYGVFAGTFSAGLLLGAWYLHAPQGGVDDLPKLYFLGGLMLVLLCGEFSGSWQTRLRRMSEINAYLEDRIERVTKRLYLLRLSHDRLEQDLLARPTTLRDALSALRQKVAAASGEGTLGGAQIVLEFIAQQCQLEVAAIYAARWDLDRHYERVAAVGEPPALRRDDPLLVFAQEHRQLAHVQGDELDRAAPTEHLVVAPIVASDKRVLGMLVVTRMPFFALNEDTLQTLAVLLSAYADGVTAAGAVLPVLRDNPGCPVDFAEEFVKLERIQREFGVTSHIVLISFGDHPERLDMFQHVLRAKRGPDMIWAIENFLDRSHIINLMPLAGDAAIEGYIVRIQAMLRENFGGDMTDLRITSHAVALSETRPLTAVRRLMLRTNEGRARDTRGPR